MMKSKMKFTFQNFISSNGPLRFIITIVGLIVLGLAAGKFINNWPEIYFIIVIVICFVLSLVSTFLSFLDMFKNATVIQIDSTVHLYASMFLFNSSIAKLISTNVQSYQSSDSDKAVQVLSGIFGMFNAVLIGWLAYVTSARKTSFPCRLPANEVNEVDEDIKVRTVKAKPMLVRTKSTPDDWSLKKALSLNLIKKRVEHDIVFDGSTKQARLFTLIIGFLSIVFAIAPPDAISWSLSDHYFIVVVSVNFCVTLIFHMFYILGLSKLRIFSEELQIFDKSFHLTGGLFLLIGGILILGSTIFYSNVLISVQERTFLAVFGILNGILYGYIGLRQKWKVIVFDSITPSPNKEDVKIHHRPTKDESKKVQNDKRENIHTANSNIQRPSLIFDPSKA